MEGGQDRKARLKALREAAQLADGEVEQAANGPEAEPTQEPVLKFRNYAVKDAEKIEFQKVEAAQPPEFQPVEVDPDAVLGADTEEVLVNVAPKKANWDLRRDIADKLARLERRTQAAMVRLMQQEEAARLAEEGGQQD
ncbi:hypothetical protein N2152v2_001922 [Parachlorella kessleri]